MHRFLRALLAAALLSVLPSGAFATTIGVISGSGPVGTTGTDSFGHDWLINTTQDGDGAWGIPGLFQGVHEYLGTLSAYDFHITFVDALGPIEIDGITDIPTTYTGTDESTRFAAAGDQLLWTRLISGNSVSFFAPGDDGLDPGQLFFVNVTFLRPITGDLTFEGTWTADVVPEPTSLLLLGSGLIAAAALRRRRTSQR